MSKRVYKRFLFGSKTAGTIYPTKEGALKDVDTKSPHYIDTVKIEWEE